MISIAIACYEYKGKGVEILEYSFNKMNVQTYKNFNVIISDHSVDREIEYLCDRWLDRLDIRYFRNINNRGLPGANKNYSIEKCDGDLIKILDQDDYLYDENALQATINNFDKQTNWLASAYIHTKDRLNYFNYHYPVWNENIYVNNTIGTPSCITLRNVKNIPKFDESLIIAYDCDFYKRFYDLYGIPKIIDPVTMVNYLWENQISSWSNAQEIIDREFAYLRNKYS
jgi:hypothetical protein